jgi:hypothetical protein
MKFVWVQEYNYSFSGKEEYILGRPGRKSIQVQWARVIEREPFVMCSDAF